MFIGIDIGGTNLVAGLTDGAGGIIRKVSCPVDKSWNGEEICRQCIRLAVDVAEKCGVTLDNIEAVGVGLPGLVDNKTGMVIDTPNIDLSGTCFRKLFQEKWDVPVFLGNDANCAAIGEYWAGAARDCDPAVVITLGTGIGGGMVSGGKLFTGFASGAMEVGHMCTHPNGIKCNCGSQGCWERYGSATALIAQTRQAMEENRDSLLWQCAEGSLEKVNGRTVFAAAEQGDRTAKTVLDGYIQELAMGLVNLVNVLQPQVICLGGGISNASDELLYEPLRKLVDELRYDKTYPLRLERASLGNDAGVVGAAMLCKMF